MLTSFSKVEDRKLKYDFKDLNGIIFGVITSESDKIRIIETIIKKCNSKGRSDFRFYQAYFKNGEMELDIHPTNILDI